MRGAAAAETLTWDGGVRAARVLFGARAEALLGGGGWRRELKRAFRKRVLQTHPDRARALGRPEAELALEFRAVVEAYALLEDAPDPRSWPRVRAAPSVARRPTPPAPPEREAADDLRPRARPLPARRLRLGEYLYYLGRVPLDALVDAVIWQRLQRPRVGRIAVDCGFLTADDVRRVLDRRRDAHAEGVPFVEYAARLGLLGDFERLAIMGRQGHLQRRIGQFFVERGLVSEEELAALRAELRAHNLRWPR